MKGCLQEVICPTDDNTFNNYPGFFVVPAQTRRLRMQRLQQELHRIWEKISCIKELLSNLDAVGPLPIKLQRMRVKMDDTSSLSRRQRTAGCSMAPRRGLSTAKVMALAEMLAMVGRQTHAC